MPATRRYRLSQGALAFAVLLVLTGLPATSAAGAVTLAGSPSGGHAFTTLLTVSHTNAGDYLVVAVSNQSYPEATAVTYNGVPMTRLNVAGAIDTAEVVILFGLVAPDSGTHDVVVTDSGNARNFYAIAQSFNGVHQTRPALSAGGQWQITFPAPLTATVPSAIGWMVLDATWTSFNFGGDLAPSGNNTLVAFEHDGFGMGMSSAPGAPSVSMAWTFTGTASFVQSIVQLRPATDGAPDVTLDNAGASVYAASTTTADATVTVGAGTNRALTAALVFDNKSVSGVSVVYDPSGANQPLSLIRSEVTSGGYGRAELWGLVAPATGASKTVRVSWTGASDIVFSATSWTNVDQTGGTTSFAHPTSNTGSTDPTILNLQITSAVHNATIDSAVAMEGISDTKWSGQNLLFGPVWLAHVGTGAASAYENGAATGYHRYHGAIGANPWAMVGCDIAAVGCTPPATPTITPGGPTTFCAGGSVTLTSSSPTGNQWYLNGSPILGATAQQYDASASGSYIVTVTASGCTSAPSAATAVTVNPIPSTPVITAPSTVAPGSTNNTASVPSHAGSTYAWTITNGTITNGQGSAQITFTAGSGGTLTLSVVETANGCASQSGSANVNVGSAGTTQFYTLAPCRILDTRNPNGPYGGPAMAALSSRTFVAAGQCGIPSGATALSINITVTQGVASGNVLIYRTGIASPQVAIIDYSARQTRANNGLLALGAGGDFVVESGQQTGTVDVIVDVNGYFR